MPATVRRRYWPSCWPRPVTWTGYGPGPTPAMVAAWELAGLLAERGDLDELWTRAEAGDRGRLFRATEPATWTSSGPGPTPATGTPPGGWPTC